MKRFLSLVIGLVCGVALAAAEVRNDPLNAVVKIETTSTVPNFWLPWQNRLASASSGSGAVVGDGLILTNAHNVADASLITVRKQNDDTLFVAKVKFVDHDCDLALLAVADPKFSADITPLEFAATPPPQSQVIAAGFRSAVTGSRSRRGSSRGSRSGVTSIRSSGCLRLRSTRRSTPATWAGRSSSTAKSSASRFRATTGEKIWAT